MSLNERWRDVKIVTQEEPSREEELIGGLQNALSRGEKIEKAKQSFISAGYDSKEIETAAQKITTTPKLIQQSSTQANTPKQKNTKLPVSQSITTNKPKEKKQVSKKFIIILASIGALIIAIALIIGLFWKKIF